jgi:RES domain-containing protein
MSEVLAEPPDQVEDLADLPVAHLENGWRVYRTAHSPVYFFRGPSRFVPVSQADLGVLYLADSPATALLETFRDRKIILLEEIQDRAMARVSLAGLRLADATGQAAARIGLTPAIAIAADDGPSQRWASALAVAGFSGVVYPASHTASGRLVALFGVAGSTEPLSSVGVVTRALTPGDIEALGAAIQPRPSDDDLDFTVPR